MPDDAPAPPPAGTGADLTSHARRGRLELLQAHRRLESDGPADTAQIDALIRLTEDVLQREEDVARAQEHADRAVSRRAVLRNTGVLGVVSALALFVGLVVGWWSGWGVALLVGGLLAAALAAGAHVAGPSAGHRSRRSGSLAVLATGLIAAATAPEWPPWWLRLLALIALIGSVAWTLTSFGTSANRGGS